MSDSEPGTERQPDNEDLTRVMNAITKTNSTAAEAVKRSSSMFDHPHPVMPLSNVQGPLMDTYRNVVQALDTVERTIEQTDDDYASPTPRQIVEEHSERLKEQYDEPVYYVAVQLLERNRREWLHRKRGTNGEETVERHGLTENQRHWLNQLQDAWREYDGGA